MKYRTLLVLMLISLKLFSQNQIINNDFVKIKFGHSFIINNAKINEVLPTDYKINETARNLEFDISIFPLFKNKLMLSLSSFYDFTNYFNENFSTKYSSFFSVFDLSYNYGIKKIKIKPFMGFGICGSILKLFYNPNSNPILFNETFKLNNISALSYSQEINWVISPGIEIEYLLNEKSAINLFSRYKSNFGADEVYLFNSKSVVTDFPRLDNYHFTVGIGLTFYTNRWN